MSFLHTVPETKPIWFNHRLRATDNVSRLLGGCRKPQNWGNKQIEVFKETDHRFELRQCDGSDIASVKGQNGIFVIGGDIGKGSIFLEWEGIYTTKSEFHLFRNVRKSDVIEIIMDKGPNILLIPPETAKCRGVNHGLNLDDPNAIPRWNCEVLWCYMNGWPMVYYKAVKNIRNNTQVLMRYDGTDWDSRAQRLVARLKQKDINV